MNIKTESKNKFGKYLIMSEDYGSSKDQQDRANLIITIWNNYHEYYCDDGLGTLDIQKIEPFFIIMKNVYGFSDERTQLPIHLLPEVLKNPAGKLKWE